MTIIEPDPSPMPTDPVEWSRLAAYVAGESSTDDIRSIEAWAAATPEAAAILAEVRRVWSATQAEVPAPNIEISVARLRATMHAELADRRRVQFGFTRPGAGRVVRRGLLAASIAATVVGGWWLAERRVTTDVANSSGIAERQYATSRGQRLRFTLPDGSSVLLGPDSELRIAANYGVTSRVVTLRGDGYFVVAHEAHRPFEVRTQYAVARDIGTAFVVRARPTESRVRVAVAEGEVALGAGGQREVILHATDIGEVAATGEISRQAGADLSHALAWTDGRLVFEKTRLDEVIAELERWYGIEIQLADTRLATRTFTGTFREETIVDALAVVRASLGLALKRDGQRFVFHAS